VNASGEICGSVWKFRPGHGGAAGGERTKDQLQAVTNLCRQAARDPFLAGRTFVWWALAFILLAVVTTFLTVRSRRPR
jgi:hypothetical protein